MSTKNAEQARLGRPTTSTTRSSSVARTDVAFWLEHGSGRRVSKLFRTSDQPLRLAGRAFESMGSLHGWLLVSRDATDARRVIAADRGLEAMAAPFVADRTAEEAVVIDRHLASVRAIGFLPPPEVTDEDVY